MKFIRYCRDRWISVIICALVLTAGGWLLWLIAIPFAVACIIEVFYAAGFFLILIQDYLSRKEFYDRLLEASKDLDEISYLTEFLKEPSFLEGQMIYEILRRDEKYIHDQIATCQGEVKEYKEYVETWVHEVKTPIAVSKLIIENNRNDITRSLAEEMDKVEGFVEQMLYYSKSSSLHEDYTIREVSMKSLVMKAVKNQAKSMIAEKVTPKFGNLEYMVFTDSKWMEFVMGQIISNGVKYCSRERKPEIVFSAVQKRKTVTLTIADNGIGIPLEDQGRVFRKGYTGENGRKYPRSTGIGLYLCDILCQKLGTKIAVTSDEKGTAVILELALAPKKEDRTF